MFNLRVFIQRRVYIVYIKSLYVYSVMNVVLVSVCVHSAPRQLCREPSVRSNSGDDWGTFIFCWTRRQLLCPQSAVPVRISGSSYR